MIDRVLDSEEVGLIVLEAPPVFDGEEVGVNDDDSD